MTEKNFHIRNWLQIIIMNKIFFILFLVIIFSKKHYLMDVGYGYEEQKNSPKGYWKEMKTADSKTIPQVSSEDFENVPFSVIERQKV